MSQILSVFLIIRPSCIWIQEFDTVNSRRTVVTVSDAKCVFGWYFENTHFHWRRFLFRKIGMEGDYCKCVFGWNVEWIGGYCKCVFKRIMVWSFVHFTKVFIRMKSKIWEKWNKILSVFSTRVPNTPYLQKVLFICEEEGFSINDGQESNNR